MSYTNEFIITAMKLQLKLQNCMYKLYHRHMDIAAKTVKVAMDNCSLAADSDTDENSAH